MNWSRGKVAQDGHVRTPRSSNRRCDRATAANLATRGELTDMLKSATTVLLGLVVCGLMLAPSSASAGIDRNNSCVRYAERYDVVQQTKFEVLFSKVVQGDRFFYGCAFSSQHARRLPGQSCCETDVASGFQLQGRYVAYRSLNQEPAATQANDTLYVYDVKTGQIKVQEPAVPQVNTPNSSFISSIVVKTNGSVAWIGGLQTGPGQADYQVQTEDITGTGPVTVDHGDDIAAGSLGKASDGLSIYWIRGGIAKNVPLQ
jgi:hypothetical protein